MDGRREPHPGRARLLKHELTSISGAAENAYGPREQHLNLHLARSSASFADHYLLAAAHVTAYTKESARSQQCSPTPAHDWSGPGTARRSTSSSGRDGPPVPDRRLRHHRGRHRRRAHRAGVRRGGQGRHRCRRDRGGQPRGLPGQVHRPGPPYEGYHVFDANVPIMADLKEAGLLLRGTVTSTPTRTAGAAARR